MKKEALDEKEKMLREARKSELDLQDALRKEAEDRYAKVIAEMRKVIAAEKQAILEKGQKEAQRIKDEGSRNFEEAAKRLVGKFKGAVDA